MAGVRFHDLVFDEGFLGAVRTDGEELRFTRQERALLSHFAARAHRLVSRDDLLSVTGSRGGDRNVDFVINRLRGKLGDIGPERRFIATQYGEGYVWVAPSAPVAAEAAFIVVGPVHGAKLIPTAIEALALALDARLPPARRVVYAPDWGAKAQDGLTSRFALEVTFRQAGGRLVAALVLREPPSPLAIAAFRVEFVDGEARPSVSTLAADIAQAVWKRVAIGPLTPATPTDEPLLLRLQNASILLDPPGAAWLTNTQQIERLRAEAPDDPRSDLMRALRIFAGTVMPAGPEPLSDENLHPLEGEIERLVLGRLPAIRKDPLMALAAAKVLLVIDRGHIDLAQTLAETAFASSVAFAASFPMLAQINAFRGDLDEAQRLYDEGLRLCQRGSEFEVYIQFLKAGTYMAADDRAGVETCFDRIVQIKPLARAQTAPFFMPPDDTGLAQRFASLVDGIDLARARIIVAYQYYRMARGLASQHQTNMLHGPLSQLVRRFGPGVASEALWAKFPQDLAHLRSL